MDMTEWIKKANQAIKDLPVGKKFELRNLYQELEWESLPKGERINLGKHFKNEVLDGRVPTVRFIDRGKNNHSKYEKYEE